MFKRLILVAAIVITCINCESKKRSIEGNWYRHYVEDVDSINFSNYEEIYFTKDSIFQFHSFVGYTSPSSYKITNDTLVNTSFNSNFIINKVTENYIKYTNEFGFQFELKKQTEKPTLEDFIRKKVEYIDYSQPFFLRSGKFENKRTTTN